MTRNSLLLILSLFWFVESTAQQTISKNIDFVVSQNGMDILGSVDVSIQLVFNGNPYFKAKYSNLIIESIDYKYTRYSENIILNGNGDVLALPYRASNGSSPIKIQFPIRLATESPYGDKGCSVDQTSMKYTLTEDIYGVADWYSDSRVDEYYKAYNGSVRSDDELWKCSEIDDWRLYVKELGSSLVYDLKRQLDMAIDFEQAREEKEKLEEEKREEEERLKKERDAAEGKQAANKSASEDDSSEDQSKEEQKEIKEEQKEEVAETEKENPLQDLFYSYKVKGDFAMQAKNYSEAIRNYNQAKVYARGTFQLNAINESIALAQRKAQEAMVVQGATAAASALGEAEVRDGRYKGEVSFTAGGNTASINASSRRYSPEDESRVDFAFSGRGAISYIAYLGKASLEVGGSYNGQISMGYAVGADIIESKFQSIPLRLGIGYNGRFTVFYVREYSNFNYEYNAYGAGRSSVIGTREFFSSDGVGLSFGNYGDNYTTWRLSASLTNFWQEKVADVTNASSSSFFSGVDELVATTNIRLDLRQNKLTMGLFYSNHYWQDERNRTISPTRIGMHLGVGLPY